MNMKSLYRLYIDESGGPSYKNCYNPLYQYFGLIGIIIEKEIYKKFYHELESLKENNFDYDPDEPIILHRKDIINKKGPFYVLQDSSKEQKFNNDILGFFKNQDFKIIVVVIDKKSHKDRYPKPFHPYHYCLNVMLERYCGLLNLNNYRGDVLAESRGGTEDKALKIAYSVTYKFGTFIEPYGKASFFQRALTSKEIKIKKKSDNIAGLQIADLLANPCKREVLHEEGRITKSLSSFDNRILNAVKSKYNKRIFNGRIKGYGKIFLK